MTPAELLAMAGLPPDDTSPQLEPSGDLRLVVATLMELLAARRELLNIFGARLRQRYEYFACELRSSGFALDLTHERQQRGRDLRRLGELAEAAGHVAGAVAFYDLALRSWPQAGCRRRLEHLRRLTHADRHSAADDLVRDTDLLGDLVDR